MSQVMFFGGTRVMLTRTGSLFLSALIRYTGISRVGGSIERRDYGSVVDAATCAGPLDQAVVGQTD